MVAPIFVHFAATVGGSLDAGTGIALWIGLGLAVGGAIIGVAIYALGGARPQTPDLDRFLAGASPGVVLAAAAGESSPELATAATARDRKRRLTWPRRRSAATAPTRPVLFAYDGSELAGLAIEQAAASSRPGETHWSSASGSPPMSDSCRSERHLDAAQLRGPQRREETAAHGALLARQAGFRAQSLAVQAAPTWKGIVEVADERERA